MEAGLRGGLDSIALLGRPEPSGRLGNTAHLLKGFTMNDNTATLTAVPTTNDALFVILAARAAMEGRSEKGARPAAALAFLNANTDEEREDAVAEHGAGFVRRALREQAVAWKDDEDVANVFWMLRDAVDKDGTVDHDMLTIDGE